MNKTHVLIAVAALAGAYALGRYAKPEKVKVETNTVYVEKTEKAKQQDVKSDVEKDRRTETVKIETTKPDGTKITETRIIEDVNQSRSTQKNTSLTEQTKKDLTRETTETRDMGRNRVIISALSGTSLKDLDGNFIFGCHVSKPMIGPITLGAWGFTTGLAGVSVGLQF